MIQVSVFPSITVIFTMLAMAGATLAYGDGTAEHRALSYQDIEKLIAAQFSNRAKGVVFDDGYDVVCPQFTSLIHSVGQKIEFITPSLYGLGAYSRDGYQSSSKDIIFSNRECRYIITVKKFATIDGIERETPLLPAFTAEEMRKLLVDDMQRRGKPLPPEPTPAPPNPNSGVEAHNNAIILDMDKIDPNKGGTNDISLNFAPSEKQIEFYGMIYFSSKGFGTNVVNVLKEFRLEYQKNDAIRAYEINYINPEARVYFSVAKELLLSGANVWTKVFAK